MILRWHQFTLSFEAQTGWRMEPDRPVELLWALMDETERRIALAEGTPDVCAMRAAQAVLFGLNRER